MKITSHTGRGTTTHRVTSGDLARRAVTLSIAGALACLAFPPQRAHADQVTAEGGGASTYSRDIDDVVAEQKTHRARDYVELAAARSQFVSQRQQRTALAHIVVAVSRSGPGRRCHVLHPRDAGPVDPAPDCGPVLQQGPHRAGRPPDTRAVRRARPASGRALRAPCPAPDTDDDRSAGVCVVHADILLTRRSWRRNGRSAPRNPARPVARSGCVRKAGAAPPSRLGLRDGGGSPGASSTKPPGT